MSNQVQWRHTATGATLYFTVRNTVGQYWDTHATANFETLTVANWYSASSSNYAIAMSESPSSSYFYIGTFPPIGGNMVAGWYWVDVYERAGANPAISDTLVGQMLGFWAGENTFQAFSGDVATWNTFDVSSDGDGNPYVGAVDAGSGDPAGTAALAAQAGVTIPARTDVTGSAQIPPLNVGGTLTSGYNNAAPYYFTGTIYNAAPVWQNSAGKYCWLQNAGGGAYYWILSGVVGTATSGYKATAVANSGLPPILSPAGLNFAAISGATTGTPVVSSQAQPANVSAVNGTAFSGAYVPAIVAAENDAALNLLAQLLSGTPAVVIFNFGNLSPDVSGIYTSPETDPGVGGNPTRLDGAFYINGSTVTRVSDNSAQFTVGTYLGGNAEVSPGSGGTGSGIAFSLPAIGQAGGPAAQASNGTVQSDSAAAITAASLATAAGLATAAASAASAATSAATAATNTTNLPAMIQSDGHGGHQFSADALAEAPAGGGSVVINPTIGVQTVPVELPNAAQYGEYTFAIAVEDGNGDPVTLTGRTLEMLFYPATAPQVREFVLTSGSGLTATGGNYLTGAIAPANTQQPMSLDWQLWDVTSSGAPVKLLAGTLDITANPAP